MYFHFRRCHGLLNGASLLIMAIGMIVGSVFEKSLIVTTLSALGTVIKGWNDFKKYALKVDMSQFAFTTYEKAMIEVRSYARGFGWIPRQDADVGRNRVGLCFPRHRPMFSTLRQDLRLPARRCHPSLTLKAENPSKKNHQTQAWYDASRKKRERGGGGENRKVV